jgi:hypothetical protein
MAAGDVIITRDVMIDENAGGERMVIGTVTLDGGNPTPIALSAYLSAVDAAVVSMEGAVAPGLDPSLVTSAISTTTVNVYAWKVTGAGDTTLIASTDNARLVNFIAFGPRA